jgi:hypothetical protein
MAINRPTEENSRQGNQTMQITAIKTIPSIHLAPRNTRMLTLQAVVLVQASIGIGKKNKCI